MGKKFLCLLVGAALMCSSLVGCGSKNESASSGSTVQDTKQSTTATTTSTKQPVELTMWLDAKGKSDAFLTAKNEQFHNENSYITVNPVLQQKTDGNTFFTALAAGTAPDVYSISDTMMNKVMLNEFALPLNDYFAAWSDSKNFNQKYIDMVSKNGKIYGIPNTIMPMFFGYNKKLFTDAGISQPPKTWDEAYDDAVKLTKTDKNQAGYGTISAEWCDWYFQYYVWQAGGDLTKKNSDGTVTLTFTDPAVIKAAQYFQKLKKAGVLQPDLTVKFDPLLTLFAKGNIAMMGFAGDWTDTVVKQGMKAEDLGLTTFPAGPSGNTAAAVGFNTWIINPNTTKEKQDAAWEYIKFRTSKQYITDYIKDTESKGTVQLVGYARTDIKLSEITKIDAAVEEAITTAIKDGRQEYYGKATFTKYVDRAVQQILLDPNADAEKVFKDAQDLATKEALDNFNKSVVAKK